MEGSAPLKVQGATAYPLSAASARVRVANFRPFLLAEGVELTHYPTLSDADYAFLASPGHPAKKAGTLLRSVLRAARAGQNCDLLLIHRLLMLGAVPGIDPPRRLDVYDFDDALFVGSLGSANRGFAWVKQEARRALSCARRARLVIAANSFLASQARAVARRVEVVPSCVDPGRQPLRQHADGDTLTIGWIGSASTAAYLRPVLPVIAQLAASDPRLRLVVVGGDTGVRASWIEHRPWSLERQGVDLASFDVGIMPLPDDDWARGKSGYKLLQYFSAGVPAVASPVGVNRELVDGERGLCATTTDEWEAALQQLLAHADERHDRGLAARAYVEQNYSYQRWAPELAALVRSLSS